mgnify:CR=1 FL=1
MIPMPNRTPALAAILALLPATAEAALLPWGAPVGADGRGFRGRGCRVPETTVLVPVLAHDRLDVGPVERLALEDAGVEEVWLFATHGMFCGDALELFASSPMVKGIVTTDTVPIDPLARPEKLTILPVSGLLAETIMNVFADDSVSELFGGDNL